MGSAEAEESMKNRISNIVRKDSIFVPVIRTHDDWARCIDYEHVIAKPYIVYMKYDSGDTR